MKPIYLFLILTIAFYGCRKDDYNKVFKLPEKTQTGANKLGFLLNGAVWTNWGQVCFPFAGGCRDNLRGWFYQSDGDVSINAVRVLYKDGLRYSTERLSINLSTNFRGVGTYDALMGDTVTAAYVPNNWETDSIYTISPNARFTVRITRLDTTNKILSGEFSGTLFKRAFRSSSPIMILTDSVIVSEGRFDILMGR